MIERFEEHTDCIPTFLDTRASRSHVRERCKILHCNNLNCYCLARKLSKHSLRKKINNKFNREVVIFTTYKKILFSR